MVIFIDVESNRNFFNIIKFICFNPKASKWENIPIKVKNVLLFSIILEILDNAVRKQIIYFIKFHI